MGKGLLAGVALSVGGATGVFLTIGGGETLDMAQHLREREPGFTRNVADFAGDQGHIIADWVSDPDPNQTPLDAELRLAELKLIASLGAVAGVGTGYGIIKSRLQK